MKRIVAALSCALLASCSDTTRPEPSNATPAAPAVVEIARAADVRAVDPKAVAFVAKGDLDDIASRSYLRVLIAPSRTHFETVDGMQHGRSVDAAKALASFLNEKIDKPVELALIETPEDRLIPDLLAGKGDIAANLLLTFERDDQVAFAKPVRTGIKEIVVTGPGQPPLISLEDVGGREIHVRATSDHHASLVRLNEQLKKINRLPAKIVALPAGMTDETALEFMNGGGKMPATVVDDYIFDAWQARLPRLQTNRDVAVSQDGILAWVTRKDAPKLLAVMNEFFTTHQLKF